LPVLPGQLNFVNNIVFPYSLGSVSATGFYSANNLQNLATPAAYFLNDDLSPMPLSPAVNTGDSSFVTVDKDIVGNPRILLEKLGALETEIFISNLLREPFDYTKWRRDNLYADTPLHELNQKAAQFAKEHPFRSNENQN